MNVSKCWLPVVLGIAMCLGMAGSSEAGVAGRVFDTDFDTAGTPYEAILSFNNVATMTYDGEGGFFDGTFIELDLGLISLFTFNLDSVDRYRGLGISILSRRIQGIVIQDDFSQIDFSGTVTTISKVVPPSGAGGPNTPSK